MSLIGTDWASFLTLICAGWLAGTIVTARHVCFPTTNLRKPRDPAAPEQRDGAGEPKLRASTP